MTNGVPIAGIVAAPAQGLLWRAVVGGKAERLRLRFGAGPAEAYDRSIIRTRPAPDRLVVATSRSHLDEATEEFLARLPVAKRFLCGSAVKFCYVAQGEADVYPRLSPTHEWDIAAGCAILAAAGGAVTAPDGGALQFGRRAGEIPGPRIHRLGRSGQGRGGAQPVTPDRAVQRSMVRATAGHLRVARSRMARGSARKAARASAS